jgi:diadenylate cyclase
MSIAELINLDKLNWTAAIDILIVSTLIYNLLLLIRGTRAVQMALGLGVLAIFFYLTRWLHLEMIQWILTNILPYFVFGIIVLFAAEIRRALANIGKNPLIRQFSQNPFVETYDEIVLAATTLASQRIGGLIVIERSIGLKNYIESGIAIDAALSYDLLVAIFSPGAPLHDGAVIVQKDRITAAACFLPLTVNPKLSKDLGTRHRAAIGVTGNLMLSWS